jgi:GNAT superfamily N-acetyltransferase
MKAGSYEGLSRYLPQYAAFKSSGIFVGEIEDYKIFKANDDYGRYAAFLDNDVAAFWQISSEGELAGVYVHPDHRRKGLFSAILFFLKRNEGFSKIILGDHHSNDTYNAVQRIYKRFTKVYWQRGDQTVPYDPFTVDDFYSLTGPTGWQIVLEHSSSNLNECKRFDPLDLGTWYFNLLDEEL